jgi:hypothetical protein
MLGQPTAQPINGRTYLPTDHSTDHATEETTTKQLTDQPINHVTDRLTTSRLHQSSNQLAQRPTHQLTNPPTINQPTHKPSANQSTSQPSMSQLVTWLLGRAVAWFVDQWVCQLSWLIDRRVGTRRLAGGLVDHGAVGLPEKQMVAQLVGWLSS